MNMLAQPRYSSLSPSASANLEEKHTPSSVGMLWVDGNYSEDESQREAIARLVSKMRLAELREMAIDIMDTALLVVRRPNMDLDPLRDGLIDWMATADVLIASRPDRRAILAAREEGRAQFGDSRRAIASERRKSPRKER
jgi:hypothetical protein